MDLEIVTLNEVSQRKTNVIRYRFHVQSEKKGTNGLTYKREVESQIQKTNYGYWRDKQER